MNHFEKIVAEMRCHDMKVPTQRVKIELPDGRQILQNAMSYFLSLEGQQMEWLAAYEEVAKWLVNSEGRGLFMYGNCGRGKSVLLRYALPAILLRYARKVVNVYDMQEMNVRIDEVLTRNIIALDDVGTEEIVNHFGNKRLAFAEIMDAVEKQGKLVLISTNLQEQDLRERYGERVLDRIKASTKRVVFRGESLRGVPPQPNLPNREEL